MTVKSGYNNKPLHVRVNGRHPADSELWITFEGMEGKNETLSYLTLEELVTLRDELNHAIRDALFL